MAVTRALSRSLALTIAGEELTECPICSSMVPSLRLDRHVEAIHPGWRIWSDGPGTFGLELIP